MSTVVQPRLGAVGTGQEANASAEALRERLHARIEGCRRDIAGELAVIEALVRMGELDGAAHALEDQRRALRTLTMDLEGLIAGAADARAASGLTAPAVAEPASWARVPAVASAALRHARPRLVGVLAAVVMSLGLALPTLQQRPIAAFGRADTSHVSKEKAATQFLQARERLAKLEPTPANAEDVTAEARVLHDQILSLPDDALADAQVRGEIQRLLTEQSDALLPLLGNGNKEVDQLFAEVRALTASLGLKLPELPPAPVPARAAEPPKLLPPAVAPAKPKGPARSAPTPRAPQDDWPSLLDERRAAAPSRAKARAPYHEEAARRLEESRERSGAPAAPRFGG